MNIYTVGLRFKEPVGAYFRVEADNEEQASERIVALLANDGAVDIEVIEVVFLDTSENIKKGMN